MYESVTFSQQLETQFIVPTPILLLLDAISTAPTIAFSTRKLRAAYAGSALRVRRTSDQSEQDIGFTAGGLLDTGAMSLFVGASSAYVTKWYDQSGNARDMAQSTAANQPQIVASGTIQTLNSKPAVKWIEANPSTMTSTAILSSIVTATAWTAITIFNATTASSTADEVANNIIFDDGLFWYPLEVHTIAGTPRFSSGIFSGGGNRIARSTLTLGSNVVGIGKQVPGTVSNFQNGGTPVTVSASVGSIDALTEVIKLGGGATGNAFEFDGFTSEIIAFSSGLSSADLNTLGSNTVIGGGGNLATYAGVTWSTIA